MYVRTHFLLLWCSCKPKKEQELYAMYVWICQEGQYALKISEKCNLGKLQYLHHLSGWINFFWNLFYIDIEWEGGLAEWISQNVIVAFLGPNHATKIFLALFFIFDPLWCSRAINREDRQGGTYTIFEILARYATQTLSIVFTTTEIGNTFRYLLAICSPNWVQEGEHLCLCNNISAKPLPQFF